MVQQNSTTPTTTPKSAPLVALARYLLAQKYTYTTITPESHKIVLDRRDEKLKNVDLGDVKVTLRDVFGLNVWFTRKCLDLGQDEEGRVLGWLEEAGVLERRKDANGSEVIRSGVRFSTIGTSLYMHSSFPTAFNDSVFLGPDTYRYVDLIRSFVQRLASTPNAIKIKTAIDIGAGSGVGGMELARFCGEYGVEVERVVLGDINEKALEWSLVNAQVAGYVPVDEEANAKNGATTTNGTLNGNGGATHSNGTNGTNGTETNGTSDKPHFPPTTLIQPTTPTTHLHLAYSSYLSTLPSHTPLSLILSNPPYMSSTTHLYSDGGHSSGLGMSLSIIDAAVERLLPGGHLVLYTGVAILDGGRDPLKEYVTGYVEKGRVECVEYREMEVDIWGHELREEGYRDVERMCAVGCVLRKV
ncbi:uncharacterized protein EV422DRAFT_512692 [Fimicolochytrium jonesii]|uniref:uncharacterized protein n=1 Tax=Fimicolochytrium jonesii TaxID=1396493 RepID=UPI0022FEAC7B|nr:uncharacterized protein EV422DRAFT_512692 [Fimicolochytrium jonesii]KAI8827115.1 hypothetical protein EV422DRAFT_512692 [Fimicolochytrium jonesii]